MIIIGPTCLFITIKANKDKLMYPMLTRDINSTVNPLSIKIPKIAVPKAVEKTIKAVVKALIDPINFTPYISAQVDDPRTFANPLEIPTKPKKIKADISCWK